MYKLQGLQKAITVDLYFVTTEQKKRGVDIVMLLYSFTAATAANAIVSLVRKARGGGTNEF